MYIYVYIFTYIMYLHVYTYIYIEMAACRAMSSPVGPKPLTMLTLWAPLCPCGPDPVGRALVGRALVGAPGPWWAYI